MWMTWSEKQKAEGKKEGLRLGKREGLKEGKSEGARSLQQVLLRQLDQRFGPLSEQVQRQVEAISSLRRLTRLAEQVLVVGSLRELRLR
jgi:flagellar biosynthesis/type III secretory pathway protein FliH